jgi:hypothetical protein
MPNEEPVCNCLTRPVPGLRLRYIVVFDPYCQIAAHRRKGSYEGPEPVYG